MSRGSAASLAVGRWIAVSLLATAFACATVGDRLPRPDANNELPNGVSRNPAEFRQHLSGFATSGNAHKRERPGRCSICLVDISIEAVGDTRVIEPRNGPVEGRPVAHIVNLDPTDTESYYGIEPGIRAEYYLWVDRKPGSRRARWTLLRVPMGVGSVTAGRPYDLKLCMKHKFGTVATSDADFTEYKHPYGCDPNADSEDLKVNQSSVLPIQIEALLGRIASMVRGDFALSRGGWIDCARGCCT
jgi:hypothetical protein